MSKKLNIALLSGDGTGPEVVREAVKVLEGSQKNYGVEFNFSENDLGGDRYIKTKTLVTEKDIQQFKNADAVLLGAIGHPDVKPGILEQGILLKLRKEFDQYINLRPVKLFDGVPSPLANKKPGDIDMLIVRENTEGEYSSVGGRMYKDTDREIAIQETIMSSHGVDRVQKYAFELAKLKGRKKVTNATKSNGISITMPFWDERFNKIKKNYPEIKTDQFHIDILTARFVLTPERFDVVVASNLFGDILSDLGPACTGTIGIAPSGNINPENKYPSLFEPVHGSAPDIAGKGIANPIGQIWSGALMLDHLGEKEAAKTIVTSIEKTLSVKENRTKDLQGSSNTSKCAKAVLHNIN